MRLTETLLGPEMFKVQGFFIRHIINYTGYNQKWNVNQIRSAQWTVQKNKNKNNIEVTHHKSIYIGKKREIKSKMCNRIKSATQIRCAKTVYWDLNSNMNKRDVQEGCANGLYRVCTHSSNTDDENMNVLQLIMCTLTLWKLEGNKHKWFVTYIMLGKSNENYIEN